MNEKTKTHNKTHKVVAFVLASAVAVSSAVIGVCSGESAVNTAKDIIDDTRYVWNDMHSIDYIVEYLEAVSNGSVPLYLSEKTFEYMEHFGTYEQTTANQALIAYANASTSGSNLEAEIKDTYSVVCKRKVVYPYDNMSETDYLYIYIDENADLYSPQQFGNFGVTANSALLVRDTNFDGVKAYSIPLVENGIQFYPNYYNSSIAFRCLGNGNNTFVYESATGTNTVGLRHVPADFQEITNNTLNTIQVNNLTDLYSESSVAYHYYLDEHEPMNVMECFFGTGYSYDMSSGFATAFPPWYLSCGYFNTANDIPFVQNNTYNNQTYINNPALPPVYIYPDTDPWASGKTINNDNILQYEDSGLTINNGQFELNPDILAGALGAAVAPVLGGLIDGTFALQPQIGLPFNVPDTPTINLKDLFGDLLGEITIYPPAEITRPLVPAITTFTSQQFNYDIIKTTVALPADTKQGASILWQTGAQFIERCGIPLALIFALALFGVAVWFIF